MAEKTVKLRSGLIKFRNYYNQLAVPFKVYADFEYLLKWVRSNDKNNTSCITNIKHTFIAVFLIILGEFLINLASQLFFTEEKMQFITSLKQSLKNFIILKM